MSTVSVRLPKSSNRQVQERAKRIIKSHKLSAISSYATSVTAFLLCLLAAGLHSQPNYNNIGVQYDDNEKMTVVSAKEKLIDATTGLGAAYNFPGRVIQQLPKTVDVAFYGYHDTVQWQDIKTLTFSYNGQTFTNKVFHSLHGEDRDKNEDLVAGKYLESVLIQLPLSTAQQVFKSDTLTVTSMPEGLSFELSAEQIDRCRDLVGTVPTKISLQHPVHLPDMESMASSENGLPITREITESSSDAELRMPMFALTPRFGMAGVSFVVSSAKKVHQPTEALLVAELADTPLLEAEQEIILNYGDTHLVLTSNTNHTTVEDTGTKLSIRTYLIAYSRFITISKSKSLSFTVGDTTIPIPPQKMAGIREIARRIQYQR